MRVSISILLVILLGCASTEEYPDVSQLIQSSQEALLARNYSKALQLTDEALALNPHSPDAHFMRGRVYFELQQWDHAESAYQTVIDLEPDYPGVHHNLGNIYFGQRQFRKALREFLDASRIHPTAMSWHAAGAAYQALTQIDSAEAAFRESIELDSLYGPVYTSLADLLEQKGMYSESMEYTEMALQLQPNQLTGQLRQARLLLRFDQIDEAIPLLESLIIQHPTHAEPQYLLGQILERKGLSNESRTLLTQADSLRKIEQRAGQLANVAENQPENFQAQVDYAIFLRSSGQLEKAMTRYLIAQALRPNHLNLQFHIATLEIDVNDLGKAETRLNHILASDSSYVLALLALGQVYYETDRNLLADEILKKAITLEPNHPGIQQLIKGSEFDRSE